MGTNSQQVLNLGLTVFFRLRLLASMVGTKRVPGDQVYAFSQLFASLARTLYPPRMALSV